MSDGPDEPTFGALPFAEHLDIEITAAADGRAEGRIDLRGYHSSNPNRMIVHGGVAYSLADTVGGAAVFSLHRRVTPTVDMRVDYLAPATGEELCAEAEIASDGDDVATVDVTVTDGEGTGIAAVRGVYKTGGPDGDTAWVSAEERERLG